MLCRDRLAGIAFHCFGALVSLGIPLYIGSLAAQLPMRTVIQVCSLAALNGLLGAYWCSRQEKRLSALPMLALTAAGMIGACALVLRAAQSTRLF